ncbi:hypothetical protein SFUMM280S_05393 [Streptomyces fumanus]
MTLEDYVDSIQDARLVIDMLVGALQRLLIYPEKGFMISQHVPDEVLEAYERLRQAGFTSRLASGGPDGALSAAETPAPGWRGHHRRLRARRGARGAVGGLREDLRAKRDLLAAGLAEVGFGVFRPAGTYFVTTDIRPLGLDDGFAFCRALPERAGVVAVPNAVFYDHREAGAPFVRFAFCKRTPVLEEAVRRLKAA